MAEAATPRPPADGSRSSDATLPSLSRRPLRLRYPDRDALKLRGLYELWETFDGWREAGNILAYRFQDGTEPNAVVAPEYVRKAVSEIEEYGGRWTFGGASDGLAMYCFAPPRGVDADAIRSAFDRLETEFGLPHFVGDFSPVFQFLSGVLTFPPAGVRPGPGGYLRRFAPVGAGRGWQATPFGLNGDYDSPVVRVFDRPDDGRPVVPGYESLYLSELDDGTAWPALYVTGIADICFAVCEAIAALLDGSLAQRSFPFACPWTDNPFSPPGPEAAERFRERWGWELAESQEALAHVLRTFYEPADPPATVAISTPREGNASEKGSGEADAAPSSGIAGASFSDDFRNANWYGVAYTFTEMQSRIVQVLYEAYRKGFPDVPKNRLLEVADSSSGRVDTIFRSHPAWGTMIAKGGRNKKGMYRLAVRDDEAETA